MGSVQVQGRRRGALLFVCVGLALPNDVEFDCLCDNLSNEPSLRLFTLDLRR